jgi:Berberine and berberine like
MMAMVDSEQPEMELKSRYDPDNVFRDNFNIVSPMLIGHPQASDFGHSSANDPSPQPSRSSR